MAFGRWLSRGRRSCCAKQKNPSLEAGAFRSAVRRLGSVLGDQRAAKLVVQASGEEIDVLLDAVGLRERGGDEVDVLAIHEHVVVFERDHQFGAKPYSRPAPTTAPQRVSVF